MKEILLVSLFATLKILLVALVGCVLAKKEIITLEARRALSKTIITVMLPCMLFSSIISSLSTENLKTYAWVPIYAIIIAIIGFLLGTAVSKLLGVQPSQSRKCRIASSLCNASYIPLPLLSTICLTAPLFAANPAQAQLLSISYVSIFLITHNPMIWTVAFPYLSGKSIRELTLKQIITPPICGSLSAIILSLTPLRHLFVGSQAPLFVLMDTMKLLGSGVFPCALLVLGASLASPPPKEESLHWNDFTTVILCKLLLLPIVGVLLTAFLWRMNWIPHDGVCALVLLVEAAVPPANNLVIICQIHKKGEASMARLLIAAYSIAVITMTGWIALFLYLIENWMK